jgi:hypothetical protein
MTASIPLDALGDQTRRDHWGRYLVVPPEGGKPLGYTRVTTVAKTLDDGAGLIAWKASMAVQGALLRRGLRARWETLLATYSAPWYAGDEVKAECKRLVEECADAGGASDRREQGTSLHAITALVDQGRTPSHLGDEVEADVKAYVEGLAGAGIKLVGDVELTVVLDEERVAGTFDRLVKVPGFDLPLILDLKTGADLSYSWPSFAVQLAAYSRGDAIYRQGPAADGSQDERLPMPAVDQGHGLIAHLPAGGARLELYLVDLRAGWEAFEASLWVREWRKAKVAIALAERPTPDEALAETLEASLPEVIEEVDAAEAKALIDVDQDRALRAWLQARIDAIGKEPDARLTLQRSWPPDLPTLRHSEDHSAEDLDVIETLVSQVERRHRLPFPEPRPVEDPIGRLLDLFPTSTLQTINPVTKEHKP